MTITIVVDDDCTYKGEDFIAGQVAQVDDGFKKKHIRRVITDSTEMAKLEQRRVAKRAAKQAQDGGG